MGNRRFCSLFDRVLVERGEVGDWRSLEEFHYRRGGAGAIDRVFVLRYREGGGEGWSRLRGERGRVKGHIERGGCYEPLVVRVHPERAGCYQILNGHHRKKVLEQLG
ncbi:MAG: hypothetical protein GY869_00310 [Planctomycetes bacterium]|nr:hypothetical protein [Planctomycetota bacterium]